MFTVRLATLDAAESNVSPHNTQTSIFCVDGSGQDDILVNLYEEISMLFKSNIALLLDSMGSEIVALPTDCFPACNQTQT